MQCRIGTERHPVHDTYRIPEVTEDRISSICHRGQPFLDHVTDRLVAMIHATCLRDQRHVESLWVAGELQGWLARELRKQAEPPKDITALLDVEFEAELDRSTAIWAGRTAFDCTATIESDGRSFVDSYSTR